MLGQLLLFFTRKNILPSRKISDVRMPRIPSVSTTNSNSGSRSSSGLVFREQSREQFLGEFRISIKYKRVFLDGEALLIV